MRLQKETSEIWKLCLEIVLENNFLFFKLENSF